MEDCYMMLYEGLKALDQCEGLILYSLLMLPETVQERQVLYKMVFDANGEIHAALEDIVISDQKSAREVEEILQVHHAMISAHAPVLS